MNIFLKHTTLPYLLASILLVGCAAPQPEPEAAPTVDSAALKAAKAAPVHPVAEPAPVAPVPSADQLILKEGIAMYNNGDYNDAIKRLGGASDIWVGGSKASQTTALKYLAFSYCLTGRQTLCRQQFEKALKLDPSFDLAPGENGHPLWGPVFAKAKKAK